MIKYCDLHLHLGGTVSRELLKEFAAEDGDKKSLREIETLHGIDMFRLSHQLLSSPRRVARAAEEVIEHSTADYLELRTTPRSFSADQSRSDYISAFISALQNYPAKAKGILSINRYRDSVTTALETVAFAEKHREHIVGVDISGIDLQNERTLRGKDLQRVIETILNSSLGLALHMGELDCQYEREESRDALATITEWLTADPSRTSTGKIRLGHVIYLEKDLRELIRKHSIPIELCPSCHRFIGYWKEGEKHPVERIYPDADSPVVIGTDDAMIFSTSFSREIEIASKELPYRLDNSSLYRFR